MKKIILIVLPLLLIVGGVVGAGLMGVVNIPGLTPKKKPAPAMYGEPKDDKPVAVKTQPTAPAASPVPQRRKTPAPTTDPDRGAKKVARIWNEVPTEKLLVIAAKWQDAELARVLAAMDGDKTAALLAGLDPTRAAKLSQTIQTQASLIVP